MYIILGLGNPGPKYLMTRHNAGFHAVDQLSMLAKIPLYKVSHHSYWGKGTLGKSDVVLAKPMTYMNNSGLAAAELCRAFNVEPANLLVLYDDLDLPPGKIRIRPQGGTGGHNGLKSIVFHLQTEEFPRIRIGIGRPADNNVIDYVLENFSKEERTVMDETLKKVVMAVESAVNNGITFAMNNYN